MRPRRRFRIGRAKAILFGAVILLGTAGVVRSCWDSAHSARAGVRRALRQIPGVKFGKIRGEGERSVVISSLSWRDGDEELLSAERTRLTLRAEPSGLVLHSLTGEQVALRRLPRLLAALHRNGVPGRIPAGGIALSGVWIGENGRKYPFSLRSSGATKEGAVRWEFSLPEPGFRILGEQEEAGRVLSLRFAGHLDAAVLAAAGVPLPKEVKLPGRFTVSGSVRLDSDGGRFESPLAADGLFPEPAMIEGGFWRLMPGGRYSLRWEGPGGPWSVTLPEAELQLPFVAPLGALTFSGDGGSELRFSLSTATPAGKVAGNLRLDGRINRKSGEWELRQSGHSDRVVNWQWNTPLGLVSCLWRNPRLSGSGVGARGEIDYSFGFDEFRFRPAAEQTSFSALPGTISGSWSFNFTAPADSGFTLNGTLETARLEWPEPRSAWAAARARVGFSLSRLPGESTWKLDLDPEAAGVNIFGAELPKLKLENLAGRISTALSAGHPDRRPAGIGGGIQVGRITVVDSVFGSGSLREFRLTGVVELGDEGRMTGHRLSAGCGGGVLRSGQAELAASGAELDCEFNRLRMTPGDNLISNVTLTKPVLRLSGSEWAAPKGEFRVSGEIRGSDLLPSQWNGLFKLPEGTLNAGSFSGRFGGFSGRLRWQKGELAALSAALTGVSGSSREGSRSDWSLEAPAVELSIRRERTGIVGETSLTGGSLALLLGGKTRLELKKLSARLPIRFPAGETAPPGSFSAGEFQMPGDWIRAASGELRLTGNGIAFRGRASSGYFTGTPLEFQGGIGVGRPLAGSFRLAESELLRPIRFDAPSALSGECRYSGKLAASGSFGGAEGWQLEFRPSGGTLSGGGFELAQLSGALRLGEIETPRRNSGGELSFRRMTGHGVSVEDGRLRFRLPPSGELNVTAGTGMLWGGRARLEGPLFLSPGTGAAEVGIRLRGVQIGRLLETLGLPAAPIRGVATGRAVWRISPAGAPRLLSADFSSDRVDHLQLGALEPFLPREGRDSPRTQRTMEVLRNFSCRALRLKLDREENGSAVLELVVTGRPTRPIPLPDETAQRYMHAIDPSAFGLDSDMTVSILYRLPESGGK